MEPEKYYYDNKIVKQFAIATIVWGVVGLLVGLIVAFEIFIPALSFKLEYLTFGRVRPIHTNAAIFAFVGNGIFTAVYYSMQRLLKTRMYSDVLSKIHFWGWQLIIVAAAITLALGFTISKEYAELEWPIDIAITLVWVVFGINMFGTLLKRRVSHIYVAIWFYIATWVTVAVLHIVNSFELPVSFWKSYPLFAGVQDALIQWWYGHNAVAFFLNHSIPWTDVLFHSKGCKQAGLFLSSVNYTFLVAYIPLYMGRPASPLVFHPAGMGSISWSNLLHYVDCTFVGRNDKWPTYTARCLG